MGRPDAQYDILTFGSITLDVFLTPNFSDIQVIKKAHKEFFQFPLGEKIHVAEVQKFCGGGSANTSTGFAKMGLRSGIFGIIGDDEEGHLIEKKLKKSKVDTRHLTREKNGISSFSIILMSPDGRRTVFHDRAGKAHFSRTTLKKCPPSRAIYISHLYEKSEKMLEEIPTWKKKNKGLVAWNPGKTQFKKGFGHFKKIFPSIDLLILNREEAEYFTGLKSKNRIRIQNFSGFVSKNFTFETIKIPNEFPVREIYNVRHLAQKFISAGVNTIVITDGKRGAQLFNQASNHLWCPSPDVPIASTLGAGDAFSVGIITALLKNKTPQEQILWGTYNASSVIQKFGAQKGQMNLKEIQKI